MLELRPYQAAGVEFLRAARFDAHARVRYLFDEMGLGKTPQALAALPGAAWGEPDPAVVIVAPVGLHTTWRRHIDAWRPDLRPVVIAKTCDLRPPAIGEAVIVSADAIGWASSQKDKFGGVT